MAHLYDEKGKYVGKGDLHEHKAKLAKSKSEALKKKIAGRMQDLHMKRLYQRFENKHGHEAKSVEKSIMRHGVKGVEAGRKEHRQKMKEIFRNTE